MPKIEVLELLVSEPAVQEQFHIDILGMQELKGDRVGYAEQEMGIRFLQASSPYEPGPQDLYWKVAIAVPDLDLACSQLAEKGIDVPPPRQFRDVGYLTNFKAPEGFGIEIIQHVFEDEQPPGPVDTALLGGGPTLNLLTLRCHDIEAVNGFCIDQLRLRLLSVQPVQPFGFTLYFYAFTDEHPPEADLTAIANRSWTYQRPYTVLEVQHLHEASSVQPPAPGTAGYCRTILSQSPPLEENPLGFERRNQPCHTAQLR